MSRRQVFELTVVVVLLGMHCFFIMGFTGEKRFCTEGQVNYCVEQVKGNLETCGESESCKADLFNWFENSCMTVAFKCSSETIEMVMEEIVW